MQHRYPRVRSEIALLQKRKPADRSLRLVLSAQCELVSTWRDPVFGFAGQPASACHAAGAAKRPSDKASIPGG